MARKDLTPLSTTGRKYLDGTARARLQSPGIEHYPARPGGHLRGVLLAVAVAGVLVGLMLWWAQGGR